MWTTFQLVTARPKTRAAGGSKETSTVSRLLTAAAMVAALVLLAATPASVGASDNALKFRGWSTSQDSYGPPTDTPPLAPPCRPDAAWRYYSVGNGIFTHLGNAQASTTHCTYITAVAGDPPTPIAGDFGPSRSVFTAAPGDELYLTYSGSFHVEMTPTGPVGVIDQITWTITGGTGRFLHAAGSGSTKGSTDLVKNITTLNWTGTINYDASDRARR